MSYKHTKYIGRRVRVFLDGGWSCSGVMEVFSTDEELVIAGPSGLISVPSAKVCAIQLSVEEFDVRQEPEPQAPPIVLQPTQAPTAEERPRSYDKGRGIPGVVPVPSGTPREGSELMQRLAAASRGEDSGNENYYGSIIPNDMLLEGEDEPGDQVDFGMSFNPIESGSDQRSAFDKLPMREDEDDSL